MRAPRIRTSGSRSFDLARHSARVARPCGSGSRRWRGARHDPAESAATTARYVETRTPAPARAGADLDKTSAARPYRNRWVVARARPMNEAAKLALALG